MRDCPNCQAATIARKTLFISSLGIPGVVCSCSNCHAAIFVEDKSNIITDIVTDLLLVFVCFVVWYYTGSFLLGFAGFVVWSLVKLYFKTGRDLAYSI